MTRCKRVFYLPFNFFRFEKMRTFYSSNRGCEFDPTKNYFYQQLVDKDLNAYRSTLVDMPI